MTTPEEFKSKCGNKKRLFNYVFRLLMHSISLALFISTFFMKDCHEKIYPINFMTLVIIILIHQAYDIYLACAKYMVNYDTLPPTGGNKLKYNKELFKKQTCFLLGGNLVFGLFAILTVAAGSFIINRQSMPGTRQHLLCINGNEWIYMSRVGNIFGTLHQILVLMQINITQMVLVRIPHNLGVFDKPDTTDFMKSAIQ